MQHTPPTLPRLHALTDVHIQGRYSVAELIEYAIQAQNTSGKAVAIQYREKHFTPTRHLNELQTAATRAAHAGVLLLVNDLVGYAVAVQAAGVHIGAHDMPPTEARALLPPDAILGVTIHNEAEAHAAAELSQHIRIDYAGIGPVFGTQSKNTGLPPLGLDGLARLCAIVPFPVIAIGNVQVADVAAVRAAGAYGVAVLSAFVKPEPQYATPAEALCAIIAHL